MGSSLVLALKCHPDTPGASPGGISARVLRSGGTLAVSFCLDGRIAELRVPPLGAPHFEDGLWQHTCCEVFVARKGLTAYHEFNLAPSRAWAAYAFVRYRERDALTDQVLDPQIAVRRSSGTLQLDAMIRLDRLSPLHAEAVLKLALSAVVENEDGSLSYWALAHAPGRPDFHHPNAFALELE